MRLSTLLQVPTGDSPRLAVVVMLCGLSCLSLQDALIKIISVESTLWQIQSIRAAVNILLVFLLSRALQNQLVLLPKRPAVVAMRALFHVCALTLFFGAAPFLSLAQMAGGLYTFPLFVGLLGILVGEHVGPRRIFAILAGFIGTVLVLKIDPTDFSLLSLMPVGAGFSYALFVVTTRRLCRDESPVALVITSNLMILTVGVLGLLLIPKLSMPDETREHYPFLLTADAALTSVVISVILLTSFLNTTGNLCLSKAYQSADSSFLAPFDYMYLLFATFWGVILIGELPDSTTLSGLFLISGAGLFVAWRERQLNAN